MEGTNDIAFLQRISVILNNEHSHLPPLADLERRGELVFVPFGGGDVSLWAHRLEPLGVPEFHLYDRELPPDTRIRQRVADAVNTRPCCRAVLTGKRSLENYLHPSAIVAAGGPELEIGDFDPVAELLAKRLLERLDATPVWDVLSHRTRKRLKYRAKRWLNAEAVQHMTPDLLRDRDPDGEILSWLQTIRQWADRQ